MPKPRRTTANAFFDVFADFPIEDQEAALRILTELHRQKQRDAKRTQKPSELDPSVVGASHAPEMQRRRQDELDALLHRQQDLADATDPQRNAALRDGTEKPQ